MSVFQDRLTEIDQRCQGDYSLSREDREFVHNAYWHGDDIDISKVLQILCWEPAPLDMPILLDASSPSSQWVHRCDAAQAFGTLGDQGRPVLRLIATRETHPVVRFWVLRELIDLEDELCLPLLDGPIPPKSSPNQRKLWIYGNFERESISKEKALGYLQPLLGDKKRGSEWLLKHIEES